MTQLTQMTRRREMFRARITWMALVGLAMIALHSSTVKAQWTTNGTNINNTNTGNVGIGTATPNAKLVVATGNVGLGTNDIEAWTQASSVLESLNTSIFWPGYRFASFEQRL